MANALWITLIGMSLVFLAILLLWGLMALLVRFTAQPNQPANQPLEVALHPEAEVGMTAVPEVSLDLDRKRRAAAAAVAYALAVKRRSSPAGQSERPGTVSAWQAVHRASRLSQQPVGSRKKVVR